MKQLTILFLVDKDKVLLAMKKRGFGAGRWNGVGGKVEAHETVAQALVRECQEEIKVTPEQTQKVADIVFDEQHLGKRENLHVHVFTSTKWQGQPQETEEMAPKWFSLNELPLESMWDDDKYWLERVLKGEKLKCKFIMDDKDQVTHQEIVKVDSFNG